MCNFKSAIVAKDSREKGGYKLYMSPWTESHSEIETIFKLRDVRDHLAKVEFKPDSMDSAHLIERYKLTIDEARTPEWFTDEMKESVTERMARYVKSIIVTGDVCLLIGGQFIIAPGAKVESTKACVINAMCGGTLTAMRGGTLTAMCGGTLTEMCGGTLTAMCGGTLTAMRGGTLTAMRGGTLTEMCGGTLTAMWGGTLIKIEEVYQIVIGTIHKAAKVVTDLRKKVSAKTSKK